MAFEDAFKRLAAAEDAFMQTSFISPVMRNKPIRVKIDNIVMNMEVIKPKDFEGWGVFKPLSMKEAKKVREPNMAEKRNYLKMLPAVRVIICSRKDDQWFGLPANQADERFKIQGLVPVRLPEEVQMFETVLTRFDGSNFWYERSDRSANARNAVYLRETISNIVDVEKLELEGLTAKERQAYAIAFLNEIANLKDKHEDRLRNAVEAAGAEFKSYVERGSTYTVEYVVDGQRHRSTVNKDTLEIQSAGICLNNTDNRFDLRSLVGVVREGINRSLIYRVGDNTSYDDEDDHYEDDW